MRISYDEDSDVLMLEFEEGRHHESVGTDGVVLDLTEDGRIISIEILDASLSIPRECLKEVTVVLGGAVTTTGPWS